MHHKALIDWPTWLLWSGACALGSALLSMAAIVPALLFGHGPARDIYQAIGGGVIALVLLALSLPAALYFAVLRRIAPTLSASAWWLGMALAGLLMVASSYVHPAPVPLPAIAALALPCWIVATACGRHWLPFLLAAAVASCCENLASAFVLPRIAEAQASWGALLDHVLVSGALGALWGAVSAALLAWLFMPSAAAGRRA